MPCDACLMGHLDSLNSDNSEFNGDIHFQIWPNERSRSGQVRSNFGFRYFLQNMPLHIIKFRLRILCVIYLDVQQLEMPKIASKK